MAILIFILGLIFGSFGSVLITRLSSNKFDKKEIKSVLIGFSYCPKCKKRLKAKHLVPLLSYIIQNGKCDHCGSKISPFYFIIEIISGLVFLLTFLLFPQGSYFFLGFWLFINRIFLLIMIYDFINYELHIPVIVLGLVVSLVPQFLNLLGDYKIAFRGSIVLFLTFLAIYYLSKLYVRFRYKKDFEGIGFGDVILSFFIGTLMAFVFQFNNLDFSALNIIGIILAFVLISALIGIVIWVIKVLLKHSSHGSKDISKALNISGQHIIPFLPAMIITYRILLFRAGFILKILLP